MFEDGNIVFLLDVILFLSITFRGELDMNAENTFNSSSFELTFM